MKIVKVRIRRGGTNENMMVYPARYRAQEVDRNGFGPTMMGLAYEGRIGRGANEEYCIICLEDALADIYARDPNMEVIEPDDADALMEQWRKDNGLPEEYVSDPNRVQAIIAKRLIGMELSEEDKRAMDPDDSCPGLSKRKCNMRKFVAKGGKTITEKKLA